VSKLHSAELSGLHREAGTGDVVKKLREEPDGEGLVAIGPILVKRHPLSAGRSLQTPAAIFDHHLGHVSKAKIGDHTFGRRWNFFQRSPLCRCADEPEHYGVVCVGNQIRTY